MDRVHIRFLYISIGGSRDLSIYSESRLGHALFLALITHSSVNLCLLLLTLPAPAMSDIQKSALSSLHNNNNYFLNIFDSSIPPSADTTPAFLSSPALNGGGMLKTPYANNSEHSVSSSEDSPSPRTPAVSDSASSVSPRPTPSPSIQSLSLASDPVEKDTGLSASEQESFPPEPKAEDKSPARHPLVILAMDQSAQQNAPQPNQQNTGKGGCWYVSLRSSLSSPSDACLPEHRTCRIRRKVNKITNRQSAQLLRP